MTAYKEITDNGLQARLRTRYSGEIAALQALGFHHLTFKLESLSPFSAVLQFRLARLMRRSGELLVFPFPLRLGVANVLLFNSEPLSIASCMRLGIKFYTDFSDDSLLVSTTIPIDEALQRLFVQAPYSRVIRNPPCQTPEEAWLSHKRRVTDLEAQGKTIRGISSFLDCAKVFKRDEVDIESMLG